MKNSMHGKHRKAWLYSLVTSALLLQIPSVTFAEAPEEFSFSEIVVTANRVATPIEKAGANIDVITREQLEQGNYATLTDVLKDINGVAIIGKGFGGSSQVIRLNGDDRVSVMIDGRKISKPEGIMGSRASIDLTAITSLDNIERIEILKGGASALYGSDAVGGVINIITRKGAEAKTTLDLSTGSWGKQDFSLTTQGTENGLSWFITAGKQSQDYVKYNVLNPTLTPGSNKGDNHKWSNSSFDSKNFTLRLDKEIDANRSFTFNFEHLSDEGGQPFSISFPYTTPDDYTDRITNNWALTHHFNQQQAVPGFARVYMNHSKQSFYGKYKTSTQGVQYQTGWQLDNKNKLITGIEWAKDKVHENTYLDLSNQPVANYRDKHITNTAVYLQDIYTITDKWTVTPGLRYDNHSRFGSQTTPKVNVNYSADKTTDIYLSYNKVFKAPNLDDLYYNNTSWGYYGNPDLRPETGHVISTGINKKLDVKTDLSANYFASKISDAIEWYEAPDHTTRVRNINKEKKHGFELDLKHHFSDKYYTELGYSYVHVDQDTGQGYQKDALNGQPNGYRIKVGYADIQWNLSLNGQSVSGRDTNYFIDSNYWIWNLAANYKMSNNATLYFNAFNLTDESYEINSSKSIKFGGAMGDYPMPSRNFQMGVKYSF